MVILEKNQAKGVQYIKDGRLLSVRARKEVILSAGTVGSAQILLLSGIGPKEHLNELNVSDSLKSSQ